jgi:hypothetical protein
LDWLRKIAGKEGPLAVSFQDLKGDFFPPDTLLESILITAGGDSTPVNAAAMGVKLTRGEYLLVQPYTNTDTYRNLTQFPFATVNFTTNPLTFATCALQGWGAGPYSPELEDNALLNWKDFPIPSLKSAFLSLKCTIEPMDKVKVGLRGMFLLEIKGAAILTPSLPISNRADNLALEAVVYATRVKVFTDQENYQLAKDLLITIKKYEKYIKSNALEKSPAWEAIERVNTFLKPYLSKIR